MLKRLALLAICAISLLPVSGSNLFTNGSFETNAGGGCVPSPSVGYVDLSPGSNCITGWTVVSGTVDYVSTALWQAEDGTYSIDMDGFSNGAISQTIVTQPGVIYDVTFWLAGNFGDVPVIKILQVSADGTSQNYTFDTTGKTVNNMGYVQETFTFTATSTAATVQFLSIDNPSSSGGPVIDNVSAVAETPEPSSFGMVFLALGGGAIPAIVRFRRKR